MASLELCSQYDYAKKALALYRKNEKIQRYYNGARYYNPNNRRSNIFDDFDYKIVKETVDATEELLKEYEQIHIKNLEDLTKDL